MMTAFIAMVCATLGQQSPLAEGLTPYQFTFHNGDPALFALVNEDDLTTKVSIPVVIDEPWNKRAYTTTIQRSFIDEMSPELSAPRRERLKREWEAAGGVEITDRDGNPYWVLKSDLDKQRRADQLASAAFPEVVEAEPVAASTPGEMHEGGATGPGFLRLWGAHVAIVAGAVVLIGAAAWFTFRRSWSQV